MQVGGTVKDDIRSYRGIEVSGLGSGKRREADGTE